MDAWLSSQAFVTRNKRANTGSDACLMASDSLALYTDDDEARNVPLPTQVCCFATWLLAAGSWQQTQRSRHSGHGPRCLTGPAPAVHHTIHSSHSHNAGASATWMDISQHGSSVLVSHCRTWANLFTPTRGRRRKKNPHLLYHIGPFPAKRQPCVSLLFTASATQGLICDTGTVTITQFARDHGRNAFRIRKTTTADVGTLPAIERSAGKAFPSIPKLAWITDDIPNGNAPLRCRGGERRVLGRHPGSSGGESLLADGHFPVGFLNGLRHWEAAPAIGRRPCQAAELHGPDVDDVSRRALRGFYKARGFVLLEAQSVSPSPRKILNDEARDGLSRERRCAMMLELL
ncbi:hypothetical protein LLEC1_06472 [Akanthomyces lecanii]|uniref:N-acetyltransferase domain-containing protein n=1 Tax=Cordyceps confragosa TaxID=2714763 RepID=A0A179IHX9_CORDF|nr:hypothetical protein LLEC1_06472 [Akanthomyces lecanii]